MKASAPPFSSGCSPVALQKFPSTKRTLLGSRNTKRFKISPGRQRRAISQSYGTVIILIFCPSRKRIISPLTCPDHVSIVLICGDLATKMVGQYPCWSTHPGTNVHHVMLWPNHGHRASELLEACNSGKGNMRKQTRKAIAWSYP